MYLALPRNNQQELSYSYEQSETIRQLNFITSRYESAAVQ